jgi:hypothetical protein
LIIWKILKGMNMKFKKLLQILLFAEKAKIIKINKENINEYLLDQIDTWHKVNGANQTLAEFLGFSEQEYAQLAENPKFIFQSIKPHLSE